MKLRLRVSRDRYRLDEERAKSGRDLIRVSKYTKGMLDQLRATVIKAAEKADRNNGQYWNYERTTLGYDELIVMLCEAVEGVEAPKS